MKSRLAIALVIGLVSSALALATPPKRATAIFAGGCFWCEETAVRGRARRRGGDLAAIPAVTTTNPDVRAGLGRTTGHAESVEVVYDPAKISYEKLLEIFWHNVDPLQANAQFCDHGNQYRSAIFYQDDAQQKAAEASKRKLEEEPRFKGKIVTQIVAATTFYPRRGVSPGLLQEEPVPLSKLPHGLRPRRPAEGALGRAGEEVTRLKTIVQTFRAAAFSSPSPLALAQERGERIEGHGRRTFRKPVRRGAARRSSPRCSTT